MRILTQEILAKSVTYLVGWLEVHLFRTSNPGGPYKFQCKGRHKFTSIGFLLRSKPRDSRTTLPGGSWVVISKVISRVT